MSDPRYLEIQYSSPPTDLQVPLYDAATDTWIPGTVSSAGAYSATTPIVLTGSVFSHAVSGVSASTYRSVTVNVTGHVTAGSNPTIDISGDTNLAVTSPIVLTGDTLSFSFATNNTWTGTNRFNENIGLDVAPEVSAGKFRSAGAGWFTTESGAFGTGSPYTTLVLDGGAAGGGLYAIGRANPAHIPFVALSGYDGGTTRQLYYGGGGWIVPDAMEHLFYAAPTYSETTDTGVLQLTINSSAISSTNHLIFTTNTSEIRFRNGAGGLIYSAAANNIRVNALTGGTIGLSVNKGDIVTVTSSLMTSGVDFTISKDKPTITLTDIGIGEDDYTVTNRDGVFQINNITDSRNAFNVSGAGAITLGATTAGTTITHEVPSGTPHIFNVAGAEELRIAADVLTFNNGATDTYLNWGTTAILKIGSGATNIVDFTTGATVFNEDSADLDFRFEGNGDANLLFTDAGNDRVGIGNAAPSYKLDVTGQINASEDIAVASDKKVYLEGMTGDTYMQFDSASGEIRFYVNGVLAGGFK